MSLSTFPPGNTNPRGSPMTIRKRSINKHSNHPPSILRQLPTSINKRISTLSSDKQTFDDAAPAYQNALGHSNFSHKLEYTPHETQRPRRNRQPNVIWFNPPFSKNVKTNIARCFLHLVDTHFPAVAKPARQFSHAMQIFLCL